MLKALIGWETRGSFVTEGDNATIVNVRPRAPRQGNIAIFLRLAFTGKTGDVYHTPPGTFPSLMARQPGGVPIPNDTSSGSSRRVVSNADPIVLAPTLFRLRRYGAWQNRPRVCVIYTVV